MSTEFRSVALLPAQWSFFLRYVDHAGEASMDRGAASYVSAHAELPQDIAEPVESDEDSCTRHSLPRSNSPLLGSAFSQPLASWTTAELEGWLRHKLLEKYVSETIVDACTQGILEHVVDGQTISMLTPEDWRQLIPLVGPRAYAISIVRSHLGVEPEQTNRPRRCDSAPSSSTTVLNIPDSNAEPLFLPAEDAIKLPAEGTIKSPAGMSRHSSASWRGLLASQGKASSLLPSPVFFRTAVPFFALKVTRRLSLWNHHQGCVLGMDFLLHPNRVRLSAARRWLALHGWWLASD